MAGPSQHLAARGASAAHGTAAGRGAIAASALLACGMLGAVWMAGRDANPGPLGFRLDDAWIHMVYGRELLESGALAYNDGIPTTGCTSPLWAVGLAAVHAASPGSEAPVAGTMLLGSLLLVLSAAWAARLALRLTGDAVAAGCAGALVALATTWTAAAFSGMEVALTGFLLLGGVHAATAGRFGRCGVFLALALLARPESGAVLALTAALLPRLTKNRRAALARLLLPGALAALLVAAHHVWASGSPLPATFHAKSDVNLAALPGRIAVAFGAILPGIPPFAGGIAWIALLGLRPGGRTSFPRAHLPLLAGAAFLLGNLALVDPVDPAAFYHVRYLLPAVPLLLVAVLTGAHALGAALPARWARVPVALVLLLSIVGAARTLAPVSRHLHNDVRNINEVQRRIGTWLAENADGAEWIATGDAGAVRYFSRLPTLDVLGLNTPEMREADDAFLRDHPVSALVLIPAWFRSPDADRLESVFAAATEGYTVTSNPQMGRQVVLTGTGGPGEEPVRVRFVGYRSFAVDVVPLVRGR